MCKLTYNLHLSIWVRRKKCELLLLLHMKGVELLTGRAMMGCAPIYLLLYLCIVHTGEISMLSSSPVLHVVWLAIHPPPWLSIRRVFVLSAYDSTGCSTAAWSIQRSSITRWCITSRPQGPKQPVHNSPGLEDTAIHWMLEQLSSIVLCSKQKEQLSSIRA